LRRRLHFDPCCRAVQQCDYACYSPPRFTSAGDPCTRSGTCRHNSTGSACCCSPRRYTNQCAGKPKTNDELKVLNANLATYRECLTAYSSEMRRYADAHIEAGNVSVEEYNEFIKVVREKTK
jgi:hypothetical protein